MNKNEILSEIKREAEGLSSAWNGKDDKFMHEGSLYHEDDATHAQEIVDKCEELEELLEVFNE